MSLPSLYSSSWYGFKSSWDIQTLVADFSTQAFMMFLSVEHYGLILFQIDALLIDHSNGYIEFNDEPFDSSRLRNRPYVTKLGKVS